MGSIKEQNKILFIKTTEKKATTEARAAQWKAFRQSRDKPDQYTTGYNVGKLERREAGYKSTIQLVVLVIFSVLW